MEAYLIIAEKPNQIIGVIYQVFVVLFSADGNLGTGGVFLLMDGVYVPNIFILGDFYVSLYIN